MGNFRPDILTGESYFEGELPNVNKIPGRFQKSRLRHKSTLENRLSRAPRLPLRECPVSE